MSDGQHDREARRVWGDTTPASPVAVSPLDELHATAARWLLQCPVQPPGFRCVDISDAGSGGPTCPIGHRMVSTVSARRTA